MARLESGVIRYRQRRILYDIPKLRSQKTKYSREDEEQCDDNNDAVEKTIPSNEVNFLKRYQKQSRGSKGKNSGYEKKYLTMKEEQHYG